MRKKLEVVLFAVVALVALVFVIVQILPLPVALRFFRFAPLVVVTDSMEGEINTLDVMIIRSVKTEELQQGDIISFYAPIDQEEEKRLVSHYVAQVEQVNGEWQVHTKSNVSEQWDDWIIGEKDILGKKWFLIPKLGVLTKGLQDKIILRNVLLLLLLLKGILWIWETPLEEEKSVSTES